MYDWPDDRALCGIVGTCEAIRHYAVCRNPDELGSWRATYPNVHTKFGIVDAQRKVLYRGTTDDKGVARYCLAHIPKGAGIVIDPDTYNDEPTPLPVGGNR